MLSSSTTSTKPPPGSRVKLFQHPRGTCAHTPTSLELPVLPGWQSISLLTDLRVGQDFQSFMTIYLSLQVSGGTQPDPQPLSQLLICLYGFIPCVKPAHNSITVRVTKLSPECHKWFSLLMAASRWRQRHYLASLILLWLSLGSHLLLQVELANDGCSWEQLLPGWLQIREGKGAGQSESWAFCEESRSCQSLLGVYLTCLDAWHCGRRASLFKSLPPNPKHVLHSEGMKGWELISLWIWTEMAGWDVLRCHTGKRNTDWN